MIGLMSGTSMDGIDAALIETDGKAHVRPLAFAGYDYTPAFRTKLRAALGRRRAPQLAQELTRLHARAVKAFMKAQGLAAADVHGIGFHGHTLYHAPQDGVTVQIGDGRALARQTGVPVVWDFRSEDVRAGGQGAPLVPVYHQALAAGWKGPVVFLNIGGVANITYVGARGELLACDTGPGNALMDDWAQRHLGAPYDRHGRLAAKGCVDAAWLTRFLRHPFFRKKPPKSLDREAFAAYVPHHLNAADGAATLLEMTAASIVHALTRLPQKPRLIVVCGGGRKNSQLMRRLVKLAPCPVVPVERKKLNGDATEAEAFAYMAARLALGLPISFKGTTGRKKPVGRKKP